MTKKCFLPGCKKEGNDAKGACSMHAQRFRRYGDYNYVTPNDVFRVRCREGNKRTGKVKKTTYKKFHSRHEHRVVAENALGRKLLRREIVHHKDGNIHNNDPSNLEVMTQSQHINEHRDDLMAGRRRMASLRGRR